ncbi:MAG: formimidoylglutamate deiminase [Actinobacteria bacterium]|nr:formimidoylglutamate deiminase [Actinomycetota bacterium]
MSLGALWVRTAWLGEPHTDVRIVMSGGRITEIQTGVGPQADDVVRNGLAIPGLVNAHSHAFHRMLRGRSYDGIGSFWSWQREMYRLAECLTPQSYERVATAVFTEMVLAGITTVGEFHYIHHDADGTPYADRNAMGEALVTAAAASGIRLTLIDVCYLRGWFDRPVSGVQRRFSDGSVGAWRDRIAGLQASATVRHAVAIHSVRAVAEHDITSVASFARSRAMPLHAHVSEQPRENAACIEHTGLTPTALLARAGAIGNLFTAVHATHLETDDLATLGAGGVTACMCPTTERDLGDGIGPSTELIAAGVAIAVGSDSQATIDILEEMRLVELHERLVTNRRGSHSTADLLRMGTENGARSLGWPDTGRIEVGALADITVVSMESVRTTGDPRNVASRAVFSATAADVTDTIVGGEAVVLDGNHVRHGDGVALAREAQALVAE